MRLKLTQTTVKYFIVTAITSTKITLYGGTDYTLANSTISNVYFSNVKAPLGFPLSPDKWSVKTVINTDIQQVSPTTNTWYNLGAKNIALPIGVWHLYFKSFISPYRTTAGGLSQLVTLSTANNSESNKNLTNYTSVSGVMDIQDIKCCMATIATTSKTTYYLNAMTKDSGVGGIRMLHTIFGTETVINAVCAYL